MPSPITINIEHINSFSLYLHLLSHENNINKNNNPLTLPPTT